MWLAEMCADKRNYKALGRTRKAAIRRLVMAFTSGLKAEGVTLTQWRASNDNKAVEEVFDVGVIELVTDGMWIDGVSVLGG